MRVTIQNHADTALILALVSSPAFCVWRGRLQTRLALPAENNRYQDKSSSKAQLLFLNHEAKFPSKLQTFHFGDWDLLYLKKKRKEKKKEARPWWLTPVILGT
jgi:hypothetical protein